MVFNDFISYSIMIIDIKYENIFTVSLSKYINIIPI